jgi:predicted restriction endonuclease
MKRKTQRKANRSGTHSCEVCGEEHILEQHHIRGRTVFNPDDPSNLANICPNCHTKVHHGIIVIETRLLTTDGYQLIWHHYKEPSFTGDDAKPWVN